MNPIARLGDTHDCPIPGHGKSPILSASPCNFVNAVGIARVGDVCGCGAVITTGFPNILVEGRPAAYQGSLTSHGGSIITGSHNVFGGLRAEGEAPKAIIDFAKLGALSADGTVDDQRMAELLADPALQQRALLAGALVSPDDPASTTPAASPTPELIAVAGSQHDDGSGNKMMFIGQAMRELAEFRRSKPDTARTLVVFTPSYNAAMLAAARESAEAYEAELVEIETVQHLIDYLNQGKDRTQSHIGHLSLFSHGIPHRVAFGYELPSGHNMSLNVLNYEQISPLAFTKSAQVDSYACRTGMGNRPEFPIDDGIQFFPQTNQSLAQLLADHLRVKVRAYIRRSDYKNTWGSFEERQLGKLCEISDNAAPNDAWCRKWHELAAEREDNDDAFNYTYQIMGATNPVITGDTPIGAPGGHVEFLPK